jgi:hypothetical protein
MPLGERKVRGVTGLLLITATFVTRLPFISHMLYEFDSIDFAVATFRFSLEQVTPHFPGYILHILFAKCILLFVSDVNLAMVWISILLSIASVLFMWRAGAMLRGERVGFIAAVLWLFTPIFWFYGVVATAYIYEAFFAGIFLYLGISILQKPEKKWLVYLLFITLSLATGARQSSILFFIPCVIYVCWKSRQPIKVWAVGFIGFAVVTALWIMILFYYSGGAAKYFALAGSETVFRSQSILFGNSLHSHISVIAKVFLYLIVAALPFFLVFFATILCYWKRTVLFIKAQLSKPVFLFTVLVALPPFLFYTVIYFMKAGYLLNILPSIILIAAVLLDQMTIWNAERVKRASQNKLLLTRPIITKAAIRYTSFVIIFDLLLFFTPFPWLCEEYFNNAFTRDSLNSQQSILDAKFGGGRGLFLNRLFSFTNVRGVALTDKLHEEVYAALRNAARVPNDLIILDTWWHRWGYYYMPQSLIYDIRDFPWSDSLWIGASQNYIRKGIADSVIYIPTQKKVLLLLRKDHPSFDPIVKQVHLKRFDLPEYLDIYEITDEHFSFRWKNVRFVRE